MRRNAKRLILSLILSIVCAAAVQIWYRNNSGILIDYGNRKPIAQITEVTNDAQKKPLKRLVWRGLSANEALYAGETIRTTENSQTKILFTATGTEVNLEPDSMVVIGEDSQGLSLEFLKGFLVVKGSSNDKMLLKSGNNTVGVGGSELALGKSDGGGVQLQVFKGEPKIQGTEFQRVKDSFKIKSPIPNSTVHVKPDGKDTVAFEWAPLEKSHKFEIEIGKSRNAMKPIAANMSSENRALATLAPGDYYWRVIGKDSEGTSEPILSSVYRLRVLPERPPVALAPENKSVHNSPLSEQTVTFRWANPGQLEQITLQIAESPDLKKNSQTLSQFESDSTELTLKSKQTYFWRITGYIPETHQPVTGEVQSFILKIPDEFVPPVLSKPASGEVIPVAEIPSTGLNFKWVSTQGAAAYQLRLRPVQNISEEITLPESPSPLLTNSVKNLKPGEYEWDIISFDLTGKPLKPTLRRRFKIADVERILFTQSDPEETQFYFTATPQLSLAWNPPRTKFEKYRVEWHTEDLSEASQTATTISPQFKVELKSAGRITLFVEALNEKDLVVARSSEKVISLREAPLLPAPAIASELPDPLKAGRNGKMDVTWTQVEGASEYILEVRKPDGGIVREEKSQKPGTTLNKLLPGEYQLIVQGVDRAGRRGIASTSRPLVVPSVSDVSAPQMKKIKVE